MIDLSLVKRVKEVEEEDHPFLEELKMKVLLSERVEGGEATCLLVQCPVGSAIQEHVHDEQNDIVYVLEGRATMWIEDKGEFPIYPGTFIAVDKGKRHRTFDVEEDLLIYTVFVPPTF
jgi:quercetin dioxygenase-like cupin family protein